MHIDQLQRMANLYDAAWEMVKHFNVGAHADVPVEVRSRFVACWGENAAGKDDETLAAWASNFLRHNARPNIEGR